MARLHLININISLGSIDSPAPGKYQLLDSGVIDRSGRLCSPGLERHIFTAVSDMFPKKSVGSVVGIGGMAGGIGGVLISKVGGALFDHYKGLGKIETGYTIMFAFCALAYLLAWVVMKALVPKYKPIRDL